MSKRGDLLIRNTEIEGLKKLDLVIREGFIHEIGHDLGDRLHGKLKTIEGHGGALIPGLHDHHIHLLALAAHAASIKLGPAAISSPAHFSSVLQAAAAKAKPGEFLRGTDYHDSVAGPLTREMLDGIVPHIPLRIQYRTGSLWVLNSAALDLVLPSDHFPACIETGINGKPTGRIWRGDVWLRSRIVSAPPSLASVGRELAGYGITSVTDTSVSTGPEQALLFEAARRSGALPQKLTLMGGGELPVSQAGLYEVGCVKIILDEARLGSLEPILSTIKKARSWRRNVAVHCVTSVELAFTLAAFGEAGTLPGDRIEHGGIIHDDMLRPIAEMGLTIVTQSAFISERGDVYLDEVEPDEINSLYRAASLMRAGIPLAGSSDAPYTCPDPWAAMKAAIERRTPNGAMIGQAERLTPSEALNLYMGWAQNPGGPARRVAVGEIANLCLLRLPLAAALQAPDKKNVAATIIDGCDIV